VVYVRAVTDVTGVEEGSPVDGVIGTMQTGQPERSRPLGEAQL
jgi:hypothetical protein